MNVVNQLFKTHFMVIHIFYFTIIFRPSLVKVFIRLTVTKLEVSIIRKVTSDVNMLTSSEGTRTLASRISSSHTDHHLG